MGNKIKNEYICGNITFQLSGDTEKDMEKIKSAIKWEKKAYKSGLLKGNGWKILWKYQSWLLERLRQKKYYNSPYIKPKLREKRIHKANLKEKNHETMLPKGRSHKVHI